MNNILENKLIQFKSITIELIDDIENEDFDKLDDMLSRRMEILNSLYELSYTKEEFKKICRDLEIISLDNRLRTLTIDKKDKAKRELVSMKKSRTAQKAYGSNVVNNPFFLKERI